MDANSVEYFARVVTYFENALKVYGGLERGNDRRQIFW